MSEKRAFAGIDIGGTNIKFGLFNEKGEVILREQRPTMADKGATPLMHLIANIGERLMYYAAEDEWVVRHLGVGSPGAIDHRTGKVIGPSPNLPGWQGMEIGATLRDRLNMDVYVDNDVNAMSLAEARFGAAVGAKSVICVTVGTGVGGGVVLNGSVWHGSTSSAGELGHMSINFDGPTCPCGGSGCIEVYCSSAAMIERTKRKLKGGLTPVFASVLDGDPDNLTIKKLFSAAKKGDEAAREVINETGYYLGVGLAGVVNLFNPDIVVIGGGITDGGAGFLERVERTIRERAFSSAVEKLTVRKATLGNDAGFIGAGLLGEVASRG